MYLNDPQTDFHLPIKSRQVQASKPGPRSPFARLGRGKSVEVVQGPSRSSDPSRSNLRKFSLGGGSSASVILRAQTPLETSPGCFTLRQLPAMACLSGLHFSALCREVGPTPRPPEMKKSLSKLQLHAATPGIADVEIHLWQISGVSDLQPANASVPATWSNSQQAKKSLRLEPPAEAHASALPQTFERPKRSSLAAGTGGRPRGQATALKRRARWFCSGLDG